MTGQRRACWRTSLDQSTGGPGGAPRTRGSAPQIIVAAGGETHHECPRHAVGQEVSELLDIARLAVDRAAAAGATDSECTVAEAEEFSVNVRLREVENLKDAGSRGAGIRVLIGRRAGSSYT